AIPEAIPEVEPVVEEVKDIEVNMPELKGPEISVDPSNASKDKASSSTDSLNWEEMMSESDVPTRSGGSSILAVSSTSKLSADLGVTPEEFKQMHETKPDEAL
ncbi:hypothetical protein A2U01_0070376, partial [Trifolium medium]|nr:hypothetical protein [Trifolium medium]